MSARRLLVRRSPVLLALAVVPALAVAACGPAGVASAEPDLLDPVYVFYPRGSCREEAIELEIWDREAKQWRDHARHPQVPIESCQLEDAGVLLQEIRWRCIEHTTTDLPATWVVGLDVFDPGVMERCAVDSRAARDGVEIRISSPPPGTTLRHAVPRAAIEGSIHLDGAASTSYDVVIALDVSQGTRPRSPRGVDLSAAQVDAAAALIRQLRHRLGSVRIGVVTFPNLRLGRNDPGGTGARREIALTDDANALDRAIRILRNRRPASFQSFSSGLSFAVDELLGENAGSGARPSARKVLVLTADGRSEIPFGPTAAESPRFLQRSLSAARKARAGGVALHLFALAGVSGDAPDFIRKLIGEKGSFRRVPQPRLGTAFLQLVSLPYVAEVRVTDLRSGEPASDVRLEPDGRFFASVPVERGPNPVLVTAVSSEGLRAQREIVVDFDDSLIQEALRAAERKRIEKIRERARSVVIRPEEPGRPSAP